MERKKTIRQLIKFILCSQAAWLADVAIFTLLYEVLALQYTIAKGVSYACGATVSFFLNRKFTFGGAHTNKSMVVRFIVTNICAQVMSMIAISVFRDMVGFTVWESYLVSVIFSFGTNYLGNRFWVFRDEKKGKV
ncbi:MAG: GtrA family protein [Christensenellaceae bacterium]|jgi:putative flippase GtrA